MPRTLVIIPALNEEAALPAVLAQLRERRADFDVLVIDDGSTDNTSRVAAEGGAHVVSLPFNMGVGTALRTGFRYAARHGYDRVVQTDADGQHDPGQIPLLTAELDAGADLVIGSRFLANDGHYAVGRTRGAAMTLLRVATRVCVGVQMWDTTSGFRGFSRPLIEEFSRSYPREFLSDTVEAFVIACYGGRVVREVPVRMSVRQGGAPSHRSLRLMFHYVRLLVVMLLTMSLSGRRTARRAQEDACT